MWNSPNKPTEAGKRYAVEDISALILPLGRLLDLAKSMPVSEFLTEQTLRRL